jgi:sugar/nucleoside kinase (ribokinase family)
MKVNSAPRFDITIAGEINLDILLYGLPEDIPLERELLANGCCVTLGSSSAITAHNLSVLGSKVGFITRVGHDDFGAIGLRRLNAAGVDLSRITESQVFDTGLTMILPHPESRHILTYPGCMAEMTLEHLDFDYLTSARHFHLSSYFLHRGMIPQIPELFRRLKSAGLTISCDTNDDPDDRWGDTFPEALPYVDILMPNEREACKIARTSDFEDAIRRLSASVPLLVVKMGSKGAMAVRGGERFQCAPLPVEVVDPIGAGDTFNAGFLHQYIRGADLNVCLNSGNMAAAFSTTRPGGTEAFRNPALWAEFCELYKDRVS